MLWRSLLLYCIKSKWSRFDIFESSDTTAFGNFKAWIEMLASVGAWTTERVAEGDRFITNFSGLETSYRWSVLVLSLVLCQVLWSRIQQTWTVGFSDWSVETGSEVLRQQGRLEFLHLNSYKFELQIIMLDTSCSEWERGICMDAVQRH